MNPRVAALLVAGYLTAGTGLTLLDYKSRGIPIGVDSIVTSVYRSALVLLVVPLLLWMTARWDRGFTLLRAAALVGTVMLSVFLAESLYFVTLNVFLRAETPPEAALPVLESALGSLTFPTIILLSMTLAATGVRVAAADHQRKRAVIDYEHRLAEARLAALQSQLQPHFLFNSLNSLAALVRYDRVGARAMLERLQAFYFASSAAAERRLLPLREEFDYAQQYLEIERVRFGDRLQARLELDPDVQDVAVPPFILQPLIENAVRHGIARQRGSGFVEMTARGANGSVQIRIANNSPSTPATREGLGLRNTRQRLEEAYAGRASLTLAFDGTNAIATVSLPMERR